jgi:predicted transposase YdaD
MMEKISWPDSVKNKEALVHRLRKERNILHTIKGSKKGRKEGRKKGRKEGRKEGRGEAHWVGHISHRNCLLKYFIKEKLKDDCK